MQENEIQLCEGEGQMHERFDRLHGVVALGVTVTHLEEVGKV